MRLQQNQQNIVEVNMEERNMFSESPYLVGNFKQDREIVHKVSALSCESGGVAS